LRAFHKIVGGYSPAELKSLEKTVSLILNNQNDYLWHFSDMVLVIYFTIDFTPLLLLKSSLYNRFKNYKFY
jgi:hypothetical protein